MATGTRTALITGSGRNMGRGCAKELARAGFNIVINGSTKKADCERVALKSAKLALTRRSK